MMAFYLSTYNRKKSAVAAAPKSPWRVPHGWPFASLALLLWLPSLGAAATASFVYTANLSNSTVSVINTASNAVSTITLPSNSYPVGIAVSPDGTKVYTANNNNSTVSVIDTASNTVTATVAVGNNPRGIA